MKLSKLMVTTEGLLCMHRMYETHFRHISLSASRSSRGRLVKQRPAERSCLQRNAEALELLVQHTVRAS